MTCKRRTKTCAKPGCKNSFTERVKESSKKWEDHHYCSLSCGRSTDKRLRKICKVKQCVHKGKPQLLRYFSKDCNAKDGYKNQCFSCRKRIYNKKMKGKTPWVASSKAKIAGFPGYRIGSV